MRTINVKLEFQKGHAIFGLEKSNEYKHKCIAPDDQTLSRTYVGTDHIEDWFIYIVPYFPIHIQTIKHLQA